MSCKQFPILAVIAVPASAKNIYLTLTYHYENIIDETKETFGSTLVNRDIGVSIDVGGAAFGVA